MDCSMPGLPVPHHLPESAQVHGHCISGTVQPSNPLTPSFPSVLDLSQHQVFSNEFASDNHNTGVLALASFFPVNIQGWSPLRLTHLICLLIKQAFLLVCCPKDFQESSLAPQFKGLNSLVLCFLYGPALTTLHDHWEDHTLDYMDFVGRVMSLLFTLSRSVMAFLPRSNHLISWLQSPSTVILGPKKRISVTTSTFSPSICMN